ncbi:hypothetical protein PI124_g12759 [Phytophthora idaei]|nr:hypothetical protein PI124_g12759 [Phytophthora idaei]
MGRPKTQWQSGFLSKEEYVTAANTFVDASSSGYAWVYLHFRVLPAMSGPSARQNSRIVPQALFVGLQRPSACNEFQALSARIASYVLKLKPVAVEKIDMLESRLRTKKRSWTS